MFQKWRKRRCKKKGHKVKLRCRQGYIPDSGFRRVGIEVIQKAKFCKRCGEQLEDWPEKYTEYITSFQSLSMPSEDMQKFRNGGYWDSWWWETPEEEEQEV